jgi:hypothetical protein
MTNLLPAQDFMLDAASLTGGGGESSGGDFSLQATVGQPEAGDMAGGDFELGGGFWSVIAALETPIAPPLTLSVNGAQVTLSWPASSGSGFLVQEATTLAVPPATTTWTTLSITPQNVGGMEVVQLPLAPGNRFYRLSQ